MSVEIIYLQQGGKATAPVALAIQMNCPLPPGELGVPYTTNLFAVGGKTPYVWTISAGALPGGLSIVGSTIQGTPVAPFGTFTFTLKVTDAVGATATKSCSMVIGAVNSAYFADSFNRTDQPFYIGTRWAFTYMVADTQTFANAAAASINVSANNLVLANSTGGGSIPKGFGIPLPMNILAFNWGGGLAPSQFSEVKATADNNAVIDAGFGAGVMLDSNGGNGYSIRNLVAAGPLQQYVVERFVAGINSTLAGPFSITLGQVMRIEVVPGASSNVLTWYLDGVFQNTLTDNNAQRPTLGVPGLITNGTAANGSFSYQNFKCGTLPQASTAVDFP